MTTRKIRWMCAVSAAFVLFAMALIMQSCGGGGGGSDSAGGATLVAGDTSGAETSGDIVKLVSGDPDAPVLQDGAPMTSMAAPPCPPPQGASANNTINAYYKPANAFDGDMNTWWVGAVGAGSWDLYYGFPNVRAMDSLNVTFYGATYVPTQVKLKVSTDGCNWTDLGAMSAGVKPSIAVGQSVRYLWVEMTGNPGTNYPLVRDIDWVQPQDNLYASGGPGANEAYYFPSKAFDGDLNTWWAGQVGAGAWDIYYMFDTPRIVQMVTAELFNINYHPTSMKLHISNDGQNWTNLGEMEPGASPHQFVGRTTQYIWIEMDGNPPSNFPLIKDVSFDIPTGASSGDSINTFYKPANAFDANPNTWWTGAQGQTEWDLVYQYASATFITSIDVSYYAATHAPASTVLYTSTDGDTWINQGTLPAGASPSMSVGASAKYIRLHLSGTPAIGYPLIKDVTLATGAAIWSWQELGGSATGCNMASINDCLNTWNLLVEAPEDITVDPNGYPVIATKEYCMTGGTDRFYVTWWTGNTWDHASYISSVTYTSDISAPLPQIAVDGAGDVLAIWHENDASVAGHVNAYDIFAKKLSGGVWSEIGVGSSTGNGISGVDAIPSENPVIQIDGAGNPVAAWINDTHVYVKKWDGAAWVEWSPGSASGTGVASAVAIHGGGNTLAMEMDSSGYPVLAWVGKDSSAKYQVYTKRWVGSAWVDIGLNSSQNGGITNNSTSTGIHTIGMGIDNLDRPIIVWQTYHYPDMVVYLKRWDGANWVEAGAGSASGAGLCAPFSACLSPDIAVNSMGQALVVWNVEVAPGNTEIYGKLWDGAAWSELDGSTTGGGISNMGICKYPKVATVFNNKFFVAWTQLDSVSSPLVNGKVYGRLWTD